MASRRFAFSHDTPPSVPLRHVTSLNIFYHSIFQNSQGKFYLTFREALIREKKRFFVKSLHKMVTPPPSPFYEVPIFFFLRPFFDRKKR